MSKGKRAPYTRPCDSCSFRKVKCDMKTPCSRCVLNNLKCTNNRIRKKCGPKKIRDRTREAINNLSNKEDPKTNSFIPHFQLDKLQPCLETYQTWYYGIWPVLSISDLNMKITKRDVSAYALARIKCSNTQSNRFY